MCGQGPCTCLGGRFPEDYAWQWLSTCGDSNPSPVQGLDYDTSLVPLKVLGVYGNLRMYIPEATGSE